MRTNGFECKTGKKLVLFFISALFAISSFAQVKIDFETIETGPYGRNSSIAVLFKHSGAFPINNVFELYLSDASGNFSSGTKIGEYQRHYTTFINGVIPSNATASANYKLKIVAKSGGVNIAEATSPFTITIINNSGQSGKFVRIQNWDEFSSNPNLWIWGNCDGGITSFRIQNQLSNPISCTLKNEFDTTIAFASDVPRPLTVSSNSHTNVENINSVHYRLLTKYLASGTLSTQACFVVNNLTVGPFSAVLNKVCYAPGEPGGFQFKVDIDRVISESTRTAYYNFPGYTYLALWDDGSTNRYSIQQIDFHKGLLTHSYSISSCGRSVTTTSRVFYNSLGPSLKVENFDPPCENTVNVVTPIQVFERPIIDFSGPEKACQGSLVTFSNTSRLGMQGSSNSNVQCRVPDIKFDWYIDDVLVASNVNTYSTSSLTPGNHTITLEPVYSVSSTSCAPSSVTKTICIQAGLTPEFKMNGQESVVSCAPREIKITNQTNSSECSEENTYQWSVLYEDSRIPIAPGTGIYTVFPNINAKEPTFNFNTPGKYVIKLTANNSCFSLAKERIVTIVDFSAISFPSAKAYCSTKTIDFKTDANHRPTYSTNGGANEQYSWSVSGGSYDFVGGTSATSDYPQIKFNDYATYTVTNTFKNSCGEPKTASQIITFNQPITVDAGLPTISVCYNTNTISLTGTATGPYSSLLWGSNGSGSFDNPSNSGAVYTINAADKSRGSVTLTLTARKPANSVCLDATDNIVVNIKPRVTASNGNIEICSGSSINFTPTGNQSPATYDWTSQASSGTVSGNTASGSGKITDVLLNNGTEDATVTYQIVPTYDQCTGDAGILVVKVKPRPNVVVPPDLTVCGGVATGDLNFSSALSRATFTWTNSEPSIGLSASSSGNIKSFTAVNNGTVPVTTTITVIPSFNGCDGQPKSFTITVNPKPAPPTVSSPVTYCLNTTATALTATGSSLMWYDNVGSPDASTTAPTPITTAPGTFPFNATQTNAYNCTSDQATINVIVNPSITGNSISRDQTICSGQQPNNLGQLSGSTITGGAGIGTYQYQWQSSEDGTNWVDVGANAPDFKPNELSKTTKYRRIVSSGTCSDISNIVTITVQGSLINYNINGSNQTICEGDIPNQLDGQTPTGGSGSFAYVWESSTDNRTWNPVANGGVEDYKPAALSATTYYRRSLRSGECLATSNTIIVNVNPKPNGNISATSPICAYNSGTITFNATAGVAPFDVQLEITEPGGNIKTITERISNNGPATITVIPANSVAGNYTVVLNKLTDRNGCERTGSISTANITVYPRPVLTISEATAICNGAQTTLTVSGAATYSWSPATGLSSTTGSSVTANPTATTTYTVTGIKDGCSATATVTVTVHPKPVKPFVTPPAPYCLNETAAPLRATLSSGNRLTWYNNSSLNNGVDTIPVPLTNQSGTFYYYVTQTNEQNCTSDTSRIEVIVHGLITGNNIDRNQTICSGQQPQALTQSSGSVAGGGRSYSYQWQSSTDDGATWNNVGSNSATYVPDALTTTTMFRRLVSSISCADTSKRVTITVQGTLSNFAIGDAQTICTNTQPLMLDGQTPTGGSGSFSYTWESYSDNNNWSIIAGAVEEDYQPGRLTVTTHFRRKLVSGQCEATSAPIGITVNPIPVMQEVKDTTINNGVNLGGIVFSSNPTDRVSYAWSNDNTGIGLDANGEGNLPAFIAINSSSPKVPVIGNISVTPTYTFNGISCPGDPIQFKITVMPTLSINTKIDNVVVCTGSTVPELTPETDASAGSSVSFKWEVSGQGITLENGNGNRIPSYTTVNGGTTDLVVSIKVTPQFSFGGKVTDGTPITYTVTVKPSTPAAQAGPDRILCNVSEVNMQATAVSGATGVWSKIGENTAVIEQTGLATSAVKDLQPGNSYQFVWTVNGFEGCPPTKDTVVITNRPALTQAKAGSYPIICDLEDSKTITLSANKDATRPYEKGLWSITLPTGGDASISNHDQPNATVTFKKSGDYKLTWTISNDAGCTPSSDDILIQVYDKPVAGTLTTANKDVCAGSDVMLTLNNSVGNVYKWQYNATPSSNNTWRDTTFTGTTATFNNVQDTFAVRVVVRSKGFGAGCDLDATTEGYIINVAPATDPGSTSGEKTICQGDGGTVDLAGNTGAVVRWEFFETGSGPWTALPNTANLTSHTYANLQRTTWFRAAVKSGACGERYSTETKITVLNPVTKADAGKDQRLCNEGSVTLDGNTGVAPETGLWTLVSGSDVSFEKASDPKTRVSGLQPGTYVFRWTLSNGHCDDESDEVTVIVDAALTNTIILPIATICAGQQAVINGLTPTGGNGAYTYQWQSSTDGANWVLMAGQTGQSLQFIPTGSVYVRRLVNSTPCTSESAPVHITVQAALGNNIISSSHQICINTPAQTITGLLPTGGDNNFIYQWEKREGTGIWTKIDEATGQNYDPGVLRQTTQFRRIVTTELCSGDQADVSNEITVTINPDAKALFVPTKIEACAPFELAPAIVGLQPDDNRNGGYEWYADDSLIGKVQAFPGYTIQNAGDTIVLKLKAISKFGCLPDSMSREFSTFIAPKPAFDLSTTEGCGPLAVQITNTTPRVDLFKYHWDFGNGRTATTMQPGTVTFQPNPTFEDTVYIVKLTATSACEVVSIAQEVKVKSKPKALFAPSKTVGCSPMTVTFNNISKGLGNRYEWDFGDGNTLSTADAEIVSHTFHTGVQDTFYVQLKAINECGEDVMQYAIIVSPNRIKLDFALNGDEHNGCAPHEVRFVNNSKGASGFEWNFGDGHTTRTTKNIDTVKHTYQQAGEYTVQLRAFNGCSDTTSTELIRVFAKPKAAFTASGYSVCLGDTVHFENTSDEATTYLWKFGDGDVSDLKQPVHHYTQTGIYNVVLVTRRVNEPGNVCIDSVQRQVEVTATQKGWFDVSDSVSSCAPFTVTFTNTNTPAVSAQWEFGEGSTATGDEVTHTFQNPGKYSVTLIALVPGGCTYITTRTIDITGPGGTLAYKGGYVCNDDAVRFEATVSNTDSLVWDFGDGTILRTKESIVYHSYAKGGVYLPSVTLLGSDNCSFLIKGLDSVKVDKINAGFTATDDKLCGVTAVQFRDTAFAYFGLSGVEWRLGDGLEASGGSLRHKYFTSGDYPMQQIVKSFSGCSDTLQSILKVKVNDIPEAAIQALDSSCTGSEVTLRSLV